MNSRKRNYIVPVFVVVLIVAFAVILYELTWGKTHKPKTFRERGKEVVMEYLKEKYNEEFCIYDSHSPAFMLTDVVYNVTPLAGKHKNVDFEVYCDEKNPTVRSCRDSYTKYLFQEPYSEYCRKLVGQYIKDSIILVQVGGIYDDSITGKEQGDEMIALAQAELDIIVLDKNGSSEKYKEIKEKIHKKIDDLNGTCGISIKCLKDENAYCFDTTIKTKDEYEKKMGRIYYNDRYKWEV